MEVTDDVKNSATFIKGGMRPVFVQLHMMGMVSCLQL